MVTLDSDIFKCCQKLKTLEWHNDAQAKSLLQRAADQVKPIMARRKWAVPLLNEFYPQMPNLLGLNHNHGQRIDIRLRSPSDPRSFLPYNSILGTLLHELAHIEVGPHNAAFYKLLDGLKRECEQLMDAGNDGRRGASFAGAGQRLGDWSNINVPRHLAREKALLAAEKRYKISSIMSRGGGRLGGSTEVFRVCDPREMALAAAERRRMDDIWCATGRANNPQTGQQQDDSRTDVIVISDDEEHDTTVVDVDSVPDSGSSSTGASPRSTPNVPTRQSPAAMAALRRAGQR